MNMKVHAIHKNARMTPRKLRTVARLFDGMSVTEANDQLQFLPGKGPHIIKNVLASAVANAVNTHNMQEETLRISQVRIDEGIVMKRFQPVSRGMAHPILKRLSHVTVVVEGEEVETKKKGKKKDAIETISADEYAAQEVVETEEEQELPEEKKSKVQKTDTPPVEQRKDTEEHEAFQKKKIQQQGGDKKRRHRRKSL